MDEEDYTYEIPAHVAMTATELADLRRLRAQVQAAYDYYATCWRAFGVPLTVEGWLAWLASDASTPPVGEEVQP